jgi:hypothetical protein
MNRIYRMLPLRILSILLTQVPQFEKTKQVLERVLAF